MFLIVGLGNPGEKYFYNRHNIGFRLVDEIAREYNFDDACSKFKSHCYQGEILGQKVMMLKPQTFMNLSGQAVAQCINFYKIPLQKVLVIHDEIDLDFLRIKVKSGGGAGGHNGLKSIDSCIGKDYKRLRFGVGRSKFDHDTSKHVLSNFSKEEEEELAFFLQDLAGEVDLLIKDQDSQFMNKITLKNKE